LSAYFLLRTPPKHIAKQTKNETNSQTKNNNFDFLKMRKKVSENVDQWLTTDPRLCENF
jgi:hypothetical protein